MRTKTFTRLLFAALLAFALLVPPPASSSAATPAPGAAAAFFQSDNIGINGFYAVNRAQRGRTVAAAVVLDIPRGYHVNANRPLGKYAVATTVNVDAPRGVRVSAVSYPRGVVRNLRFAQGERLAVYEGRTLLRFYITFPADFPQGVAQVRARVRFQACTDEVCYPPATRNLSLPIGVVGANDPVQRTNTRIFGRG